MQIIKTSLIVVLAIAMTATVGTQQVFATQDMFRVQVILDGIDSLTGQLDVTVRDGDGETYTDIIDPFKEGYAGHYTVDDFIIR